MIGFVLFGVAMIRTATLPRWSGVLVAVGRSGPFVWFRDRSTRLNRRLADPDSRQRQSWPPARLGRLSALADTGRFRSASVR